MHFTLHYHSAETASIRPTVTHTTQGAELILNSQKHSENIKAPEQSQKTSFHKSNFYCIHTFILFSKNPYLPMYPSHASPSLPGPHSRWTRLKKSHWAWSPHDSCAFSSALCLLSLPATSSLNSLPLSDYSLSRATAVVTLLPGHMTAEFKPQGSPLGLRSNDSQGLSEWNW